MPEMSSYSLQALAETGKAVLVSQQLEKLLFEMFEFRKLHKNFEYAVQTGGAMTPEKYKFPLMNGVKLLRGQGAIHPTVDVALTRYIEDRHVLVHRWALQRGIPEEANALAWDALKIHAVAVSHQALALLQFIATYLAEHAMPDVAARDYPTYQARMLDIFNRELKPV